MLGDGRMTPAELFVLEDEPDIREVMVFRLQREGFTVHSAGDGIRGWEAIQRLKPDLILLDIMLPGLDGLEICRRLRENRHTRDIRVIIVTAKGEEDDVVKGLEAGADDYLVKPFSTRELVARVRAVLRRGPLQWGAGEEILRIPLSSAPTGEQWLTIDPLRMAVVVADTPVTLTTTQFRMLYILASTPGRVFTRKQLLQRLLDPGVVVSPRTVDVHIRALRQKLGPAASLVETVRGVGYRFKDEL